MANTYKMIIELPELSYKQLCLLCEDFSLLPADGAAYLLRAAIRDQICCRDEVRCD